MFHVAMTKASDRICTDGVDVGETTAPRTKLVAEIPQKLTSCETEPPKRGKLKDKMLQAHQESICQSFDLTGTPESPPPVQRTSGPETRRTRQSSPKLSLVSIPQTPEAWTVGNPDWQSQWHKSLVYPPTGKNRATVDAEDIRRLDEGQFLNDNLISFYLRYLQVQLEKDRPEVLDKVYIFSSFFFDKLKTSKNRYEGVKAWTAKVDLLSYDYIVVPVNEHAHWYLAIICNVAGALPNGHSSNGKDEPTSSNAVGARPSTRTKMPAMEEHVKSITLDDEPESSPAVAKQGDNATTPSPRPSSTNPGSPSKPRKSVGGSVQRFDPKEPKIITLDSLGNSHSPTCRILKEYLAEEAKDKKGAELAFNPSGMTGKGIPEQDNFCDCGVFVLGYMEEFLKDPDEASRRLLQKELLGWNVKPTQLRQNIRDLLFSLQKEQQERLNREREEKKQARRKMKAEANSQLPSSSATAVPPTSSQEPLSRQSLAPSQMSSPSKDPPSKESSERVKDPEMTETVPTPGAPEAATPKGRPNILDKPEPNFISRLTDGDDAPGVDDESPEMFYSAPSSPPKDEHKAKESRATSPKGSPKGRFVERIYSSGSEDKKEPKESKASIRPSVEVEDGETTSVRSPKRSKSKRPSTVSVDIEHWDSDEPDVVATKRPKYDGVKRSQE